MKFKVRIILNIKHSSDMPQAVSPYHYGGLLRPATPPFLLSPLIPPVFTCF